MAQRSLRVVRRGFTPRDQLRDRLSGKLRVQLRTEGYVHVGTGEAAFEPAPRAEAEAAVREFLRTGRLPPRYAAVGPGPSGAVRYGGRPCIPGSTVKGLLRARLELGAKAYGDGVVDSCLPRQGPPLRALPRKGEHGWRHVAIWGPPQPRVSEEEGEGCDPLRTGSYDLCVVCDLFGAPGVSARVLPGNLCLERGRVEVIDLPYGERVEALAPGSVLSGEVAFTSLKLEELGLLLMAMGLCRREGSVPVLVGKHKYAYKRMGVARFSLLEARFVAHLLGRLESEVSGCEREGWVVVCRGSALEDLVRRAIGAAVGAYGSWRDFECFSEAKVRDEKGLAEGGA